MRAFPSWRLRSLIAVPVLALLVACPADEDDAADPTPSPTQEAIDADAYAANSCGAITDWTTRMQEANIALQQELSDATQPGEVQEQLVAFLDDAIEGASEMIGQIEEGGPPDVDDGDAIHDRLVEALGDARAALTDARGTVEDLDATDQQALGDGLAEVGTSLQAAFDDIANPLEDLQNDDLDRAFREAEECAGLNVAGGA